MKKKILVLFAFLMIFIGTSIAQPYVDVVNASFQTFGTKYSTTGLGPQKKNRTNNVFCNLFLPKELKSGHTLLIRFNTETINTIASSSDFNYSYRLSSFSLPLGIKLVTKSKKWETILIGIPKLASDFRDPISGKDFQYGGIFLQHWLPNDKVKVKAGLYYNREAFGNFFMPLVGLDWKVNDRLYLYGILPTNYKAEVNILKDKLYCGVNFKSLTRSFSLSKLQHEDYVRYNEMQLKLFVDWFAYKKILLFGEVGYSLGESPVQYTTAFDMYRNTTPVYKPLGSYMLFNVGIAYRVRLDLAKKDGAE